MEHDGACSTEHAPWSPLHGTCSMEHVPWSKIRASCVVVLTSIQPKKDIETNLKEETTLSLLSAEVQVLDSILKITLIGNACVVSAQVQDKVLNMTLIGSACVVMCLLFFNYVLSTVYIYINILTYGVHAM